MQERAQSPKSLPRAGLYLCGYWCDVSGMALYMIEQKTDIQHMDAVRSACDAITIDIRYSDGEQQVILNGRNVNDFYPYGGSQ